MYEDLSKQRFGRLFVIKRVPNRGSKRFWLCLCDCGKEKEVSGFQLKRKHTSSCGCLRVELLTLPGDEGSFNSYFSEYKQGAKQRNYSFHLTKDQFRKITSLPCSYCGSFIQPYYAKNRKSLTTVPYLCNGIDRVNNDIGYSVENCVSCCNLCNLMKRGLSVDNFKAHIRKIYHYEEKKDEQQPKQDNPTKHP